MIKCNRRMLRHIAGILWRDEVYSAEGVKGKDQEKIWRRTEPLHVKEEEALDRGSWRKVI